MDIVLNAMEVRVLGCLMEKEMATPDYYPLSLNALTNACNQKSNRHPVADYDEEVVLHALQGLMDRKLARQSNVSRVPKYEQIFTKELNMVAREEAIICILLLRGPQTVGEIRGRTERLFLFADLNEVEDTTRNLEEMGMVKKLPRQAGRKECRYSHFFSGEPQESSVENIPHAGLGTTIDQGPNEEIINLQDQINDLRGELEQLRSELAIFKSQFE